MNTTNIIYAMFNLGHTKAENIHVKAKCNPSDKNTTQSNPVMEIGVHKHKFGFNPLKNQRKNKFKRK